MKGPRPYRHNYKAIPPPLYALKDGEPCPQIGCRNHFINPCPCCGRLGAQGEYIPTVPPIRELWEKYQGPLRAGRQPGTNFCRDLILQHFLEFFPDDKPISSYTREDIAQWVAYMLELGEQGGQYILDMIKAMRRFFQWCVEDGIVRINPVQLRRLPTIPIKPPDRLPFTHDQFQRVLRESSDASRHREFWPSAIRIAWHTGLRCGDVANLEWTSVNFDDETIHTRPRKMRRYGQKLEIPIEPELYEHLLELHNRRIETSPFVLPYMQAFYVQNRRTLENDFSDICERVGLPEHTFHCFRHGFVSRLLNAGVDPVTIASMTGQSLEMIQHYAHVSNQAKADALARARAALHAEKLARLKMGPSFQEQLCTPTQNPEPPSVVNL